MTHVPLFTKFIIGVKLVFWIVQFYTTKLDLACRLDAHKLVFGFELWRLVTACFVNPNTHAFFGKFYRVVPLVIGCVLNPMEWKKGTSYTAGYFFAKSVEVCIIKTLVFFTLCKALNCTTDQFNETEHGLSMSADDTWSVMALVEFYKYIMVRPNKMIDIMIGKF
jgi:hypothetical protein